MNKHEWSPWFWAQTECCSALCFSCPGCACSLWPLWARSPSASEPHAASPFPSAEHGAACGSVPPLFPSPHGHSVLPSLPSPASKCTPLTPDVTFATARITKGYCTSTQWRWIVMSCEGAMLKSPDSCNLPPDSQTLWETSSAAAPPSETKTACPLWLTEFSKRGDMQDNAKKSQSELKWFWMNKKSLDLDRCY